MLLLRIWLRWGLVELLTQGCYTLEMSGASQSIEAGPFMPVETAPSSWKLLEESHLHTAEQLTQIRQRHEREPTPRNIARRLVREGMLTRWHAEQLLAGRNSFRFGDYTLLHRVGKGNMGTVFEARHAQHPQTVALKIMAKDILKDPVKVARFQREMRTVASLQHPNIISFHDSGRQGSVYYLAMEYVPGRDLRDLLRDHRQLPVDFSCESIRQAALGLQYAFERGMVHRDIKPDNLLVSLESNGRPLVKILDFGLSKFAEEYESEQAALTRQGQLVGTPNYVAPEMVTNPEILDIRSDIFGLGCTLFRLITGVLPFPGETAMEKLLSRLKQDATPIQSLRPETPPLLAAAIAKMLARDPNQRYQRPMDLAVALAPFGWRPGSPPPAVNLIPPPPPQDPSGESLGSEDDSKIVVPSDASKSHVSGIQILVEKRPRHRKSTGLFSNLWQSITRLFSG